MPDMVKGKEKGLTSASVEARRKKNRKSSVLKVNPFEVRINKSKYAIIGRRLKHDRGLPGLSRSKAIKKRKQTLLEEYKNMGKNNTFVDKRFGEYNEGISLEEKMLKRFTLEKQHHHEKSGQYNLNDDDDELTHFGQSLAELNNFDDADLKLTDDEDGDIDENHFGGFLRKKEERKDDDKDKTKSKKEIMDEIVAKSKLKKFERQQAQEEAFQLTQELDTDWKSVHKLLTKRDNADEERQKADDYDILVKQLMFEIKAKPTERMKTEEEAAKEEKERLQNLEEERRERMRGNKSIDDTRDNTRKHISADDLGESFKPPEDKRFEVKYKDGQMVMPGGLGSLQSSKIGEENTEDNESGEEDDQDDDDDGDDDYSDVLSDDEMKCDIESAEDSEGSGSGEEEDTSTTDKRTENKTSKTKTAKIEKELPYTFKAPNNLQEFLEIVEPWKFDQQLKIIERIRKCHHPKLAAENTRKMEKLFDVLLQYIDYLADQKVIPMNFINNLARPLFGLANDNPHHSAVKIQRRLRRAFKKFWNKCRTSGGKDALPNTKEILLLKMIAILFPTSDLDHNITTPALVYMAAMLSKSYLQHTADILTGLLISTILYEFVCLSKRFVPEVINFLTGLLRLAVKPTKGRNDFSHLKVHHKNKGCLYIDKTMKETPPPIKISDILTPSQHPLEEASDEFRISCMRSCLCLIKKFSTLYQDVSSFQEIFLPIKETISRLPVENYPKEIQAFLEDVRIQLDSKTSTPRQPLTMQARKPIPLPLLEPKFDERYEVKSKRRHTDKDTNEKQKLKYKYKREFKGAVREIRKDNQFLAKEKLREVIQRDTERSRKTREIEGQLAQQQGELNAFNRSKNKKR